KEGGDLTGASDVYSLAVVLEELGGWRHPLLLRMRSAAAERRPSAEEVASTLGRLGTSTTRRLVALRWAIVSALVILLAGFLARMVLSRSAAPASVAPYSSDFHIAPLASLSGAERQPSISPDGTRVAFAYAETATSNTRIVVKNLSDPNIARLTSGRKPELRPVFSPDGTRLAFLRALGGRLEIVVVPSEGGAERRIAEIADLRREYPILTWDANGQNLIVCDRPPVSQLTVALFKISVSTGARRQITFPPAGMNDWMPQVSPDGTTLGFARLFETGRGDIWTIANGQPPHRLTTSGDVFFSWAWYRQGREVLIAYRRSGRTLLWRQAAAGGRQLRVTGLEKDIREFSVSRSGTALVFGSGTEDFNVWSYPFPPSKRPPRPLIASAGFDGDARYSPDGKNIVFSSTRSGQGNIWICSRDGSGLQQVTTLDSAGFTTGSPAWSPDGQWIAFDSRSPGQESSIFLVDPAGRHTRRLTGPGPSDIIPSWSRDAQWVYFASDREPPGTQIWKVPVSGGPAVRVTRHGGYEAFESADGDFLYFTRKGQKAGFWRMPLSGGEETPVVGLEDIGNRDWDGSSEGIYFVAR
ncbi:MAG TPA: hypothetical protein VN828_17310, partial [Acidobacteriaceae bacterium]|nr:hypothetical protein [Acidobacteriaceae bacterium]